MDYCSHATRSRNWRGKNQKSSKKIKELFQLLVSLPRGEWLLRTTWLELGTSVVAAATKVTKRKTNGLIPPFYL